ncbi:porin family protein [Sphingobacterium rhinopitheci]|uniref:porin family protein n=1 Tax=Sphingobacterium rhinopitheci TaxID=2781960 RepID=UPI001F516F8B|nr:porin family protein [Sphingobacterium rhinopitheci]MCI0921103.1 PorT family protein [Sphingobacterium rhinopitheci]
MKKTIITVLTLLCASSITVAQELKLGIKAGLNFSELKSNDKWFNSDSKAGYQAGIWGRVGVASFFVQPEAYFTSKSATIHPDLDNAAGELLKGDIKFTNIDVPILIGKKFNFGLVNARLQAGPLFSFVINENNPYGKSINQAKNEALTNYKKQFSSLVFGTGIDVLMLSVDLRYELGLGNISKYDGPKQKLNLWTVSVGYSIF